MKENENENYIYLGDTKRFPYGSKSKESIIELTKKGIDFLINKNVKAVIIACGTASSQALEEVQKIYKIPIIGIINPTVEYIKYKKNLRNIGVIATTGTIRSKGWENSLKQNIKGIRVINKACPLLAPMAEEGWTNNEIARLTIREYIKELKDKNVDALILGCTHYPLFKHLIKQEFENKVEIINTGVMISRDIKNILEKLDIENDEIEKNNAEIYLTDTETNFINVANKLLNKEIEVNCIDKVNILNYSNKKNTP